MTAPPQPDLAPGPGDPWFRRRHGVTLAVAGVLYAGILALLMLTGDPADGYSMLYAFPVALVATAFGMRAGALAGLVAVALIALWVVLDDVPLDASGWASRVLPTLLLGTLLGRASDRMRQAEQERRTLAASALLHREAIEINDTLVQGMAAAKWLLDAGQVDAGRQTLDGTIGQAHELVSGLIRRAGMGGRSEPVQLGSDRTARSTGREVG